MPDIAPPATADPTPAGPAPIVHPMDPRRGENLSPRFSALLCWLLQLPPMTTPAITGIVVTGTIVFAATDRDPFHNTLIGPCDDVQRNLRDWGAACGVDPKTVDGLIAKLLRASR